jgi:hypothetical protein
MARQRRAQSTLDVSLSNRCADLVHSTAELVAIQAAICPLSDVPGPFAGNARPLKRVTSIL